MKQYKIIEKNKTLLLYTLNEDYDVSRKMLIVLGSSIVIFSITKALHLLLLSQIFSCAIIISLFICLGLIMGVLIEGLYVYEYSFLSHDLLYDYLENKKNKNEYYFDE